MSRKYITYLWTWPLDILVWLLWILPFYGLWGHSLRWEEGSLVFNLKRDSWFNKRFYKKWSGTSIAHAIMYSDKVGMWDGDEEPHRIVVHEQYHVKQYESLAFSGFLLSWVLFAALATFSLQAAFAIQVCVWLLFYPFSMFGNWITAAILGQRAYRDAVHEQSAYAVDFKYQRTGKRDT